MSMALTVGRVLALVIAVGWAVVGGVSGRSFWGAVMLFVLLLVPLSLIWFAEFVRRPGEPGGPKLTVLGFYKKGGLTGADRPSHPAALALLGWFLLVGLPVLLLLFARWARNPT
jgi:hypothetical protein